MRRLIVIVLIFLLAGGIVNVSVAWTILWRTDWTTVFEAPYVERAACEWPRDVPPHWPEKAEVLLRTEGPGILCLLYHALRPGNRVGRVIHGTPLRTPAPARRATS